MDYNMYIIFSSSGFRLDKYTFAVFVHMQQQQKKTVTIFLVFHSKTTNKTFIIIETNANRLTEINLYNWKTSIDSGEAITFV